MRKEIDPDRSFGEQAWEVVDDFGFNPISGYSKSYYEADLKMNAMIITLLERLLRQRETAGRP